MEVSKVIAVLIALVWSGNAFSQDIADAASVPPAWPEYRCHASEEGKGTAISRRMQSRLESTDTMAAAEAVPILESMLPDLKRTSAGNVQVAYALAWRYQELGRRDDLRTAIRQVLESPYVVGAAGDAMRALLAQSYADEGDWETTAALLKPMIDAGCRPISDVVRQLLARASIKRKDYAGALQQLNRVCMLDDPDQRHWMRSALEVDCQLNGPEACVQRIVRYAEGPPASTELLLMLNTALSQLQAAAEARPYLDQARDRGELTDDYRVVIRARPVVEELIPMRRMIPEYPRAAARNGQSGFVIMRIRVGSDGKVLQARVLDAAPPGVFDAAALEAAKEGTFKPRLVDGQPVETEGRYTITFSIDDGRPRPTPDPDAPIVAPKCRGL